MSTCCALPFAVLGVVFIVIATWFNRDFVVDTLVDEAKKHLDEAGLELRKK